MFFIAKQIFGAAVYTEEERNSIDGSDAKHLNNNNTYIEATNSHASYVQTVSVDDVNSLRFLGYSSPLQLCFTHAPLEKHADFISTINGSSAYTNTCINSQTPMSLKEKIAFLLKSKEVVFEHTGNSDKKITGKNRLKIFIKPNEYCKMEKNGKIVHLGHFQRIDILMNQVVFTFTDGDMNSFGSKNSSQVIFLHSEDKYCNKEFMDKPGQYQITIGMPELIKTLKIVELKAVTVTEANKIKVHGFVGEKKKEDRQKENIHNKREPLQAPNEDTQKFKVMTEANKSPKRLNVSQMEDKLNQIIDEIISEQYNEDVINEIKENADEIEITEDMIDKTGETEEEPINKSEHSKVFEKDKSNNDEAVKKEDVAKEDAPEKVVEKQIINKIEDEFKERTKDVTQPERKNSETSSEDEEEEEHKEIVLDEISVEENHDVPL